MNKRMSRRYTPSGDSVATSTLYKHLFDGIMPANNSEPLTYVPKLKQRLQQAGRHKTNRKPTIKEYI